MRRKLVVLGLAFAVAAGAASLTAVPSGKTEAASGPTFIVPANDGYGVGDCVSSGSACGQVVADAWCEAQGFARSASFGLAEAADTTSSTGSSAGRPISITCAE